MKNEKLMLFKCMKNYIIIKKNTTIIWIINYWRSNYVESSLAEYFKKYLNVSN